MLFIEYPKCTTCKRAKKWLDDNGMEYIDRHIKEQNPTYEELKLWKDKSGLPYVFHPFHLAEQMEDEDTTIVALLHDVIEDTEYTIEDLQKAGFTQNVISAIALMTHDPQMPYMEYVRAIKSNPIARAVKLADLRHNSDMTRLDIITQRDEERAQKYLDAIVILEEV